MTRNVGILFLFCDETKILITNFLIIITMILENLQLRIIFMYQSTNLFMYLSTSRIFLMQNSTFNKERNYE